MCVVHLFLVYGQNAEQKICCYFCFITTFLIAPSTTRSEVEVCTLQERRWLPCAAQSGTDGENMKWHFCLVACARLEMDSVNLGRRSQDWHTKAEEKFRHALHNQTLKAKNTTISHFTLNYMTYVQNSLRKGDRMNGAGWCSGDAGMGGRLRHDWILPAYRAVLRYMRHPWVKDLKTFVHRYTTRNR